MDSRFLCFVTHAECNRCFGPEDKLIRKENRACFSILAKRMWMKSDVSFKRFCLLDDDNLRLAHFQSTARLFPRFFLEERCLVIDSRRWCMRLWPMDKSGNRDWRDIQFDKRINLILHIVFHMEFSLNKPFQRRIRLNGRFKLKSSLDYVAAKAAL